jgi:chromosome segregation ATPase
MKDGMTSDTCWHDCRKELRTEIDQLQSAAAEADKQHQAILDEKQVGFDKALAANLRMVEDQAAQHLATIKKDMDTSKACMAENSEKIDIMQKRYADLFTHACTHDSSLGCLVYDLA